MSSAQVADFIIVALKLIATAAPGFLAAFSGKRTDDEALEHARAELGKINPRPAGSALDEYEKKIT